MVQIPAGCREQPLSLQGTDTIGCLGSFWMDTTEVTIQGLELWTGSAPSYAHQVGGSGSTAPCPRCPIENLTWFEAVLAANARTQLELSPQDTVYTYTGIVYDSNPVASRRRLKPRLVVDLVGLRVDTAKLGYRLPTRREWVYAALQSGHFGTYWNTVPWTLLPNGQVQDIAWDPDWKLYAWFRETSGGTTRKVASLLPNDWSLYDLLGNVPEWLSQTDTLAVKDSLGQPQRIPLFAVAGGWSASEDGTNNPFDMSQMRSGMTRISESGLRLVRRASATSASISSRPCSRGALP